MTRGAFFVALASLSPCCAQQPGCTDPGAPPTSAIAPSDFVELKSTSSCMDPCPIYTVRVQANGTVTWNGQRGIRTPGPATRQVSAEAARALIESYRAAGFWSPCIQDRTYGEDGPDVRTTVHIGSQEKSIRGTPDWKLYQSVGEVAGTYYWIHGDPHLESIAGAFLFDSEFAPKPGFTPLMRAAMQDNISALQQELATGADVNARDASGFNALMCAARTAGPEPLKILLQAGANPNLRTNLGQTALMAAGTSWRAPEENIAKLAMLISSGADINAQDRDGRSALILAVPRAEPAVISFLLKAGARRDAALNRVLGELNLAQHIGSAAQIHRLEQVRDILLQP